MREGHMNERSVKEKSGMGEWGSTGMERCPLFLTTSFTSYLLLAVSSPL